MSDPTTPQELHQQVHDQDPAVFHQATGVDSDICGYCDGNEQPEPRATGTEPGE